MGKRFNDLDRRAYALLAGGGNPANSQDAELKNYWTWRLNPADESHDLPTASERSTGRKLDVVNIEPFNVQLVADLFAKVTISKRSNAGAGDTVKTACGLKVLTDGTNNTAVQKSIYIGRFKPARVYWRTGDAAESIVRTSRITKRKYKSYYSAGDQGYSVPFGKVGADSVNQRQAAIKAALPNINLVSFSPEIYRG